MDDDVGSSPSVDNICRLCLSSDEPKTSIFLDGDDSSVPLSSKIQACLAIQVSSSDKLSTLICRGCIKNVNQWHSYRESCLKAQDKLQQWQMQQMSSPMGVTIKQEPIDLDFDTDQIETITELRDASQTEEDQNDKEGGRLLKNETLSRRRTRSFAVALSPSSVSQEIEKNQTSLRPYCTVEVKDEPLQDDDYDSLETESVTGGEILPNPVAAMSQEKDRVMEADSTQKPTSVTFKTKKRMRRGPYTHFRKKHVYRKKCVYCQINLHSKYSYTKHMERFHSNASDSEQRDDKTELKMIIKQKQYSTNSQSTTFQDQNRFNRNNSQDESLVIVHEEDNAAIATNSWRKDVDEEMIEDVEDEIDNMDKDSETPLSQVQQNIIGQLKTYSCYSCKQVFPDRRSTLNHLRQHLPDLRPFTCVACLTQFPDRSIYKDHCYTSFECAMKIATVEPKSGLEKYFTCNMCSKSVADRKELLHHLTTEHSEEHQNANATPTSSKKIPAKITLNDSSSPSTASNWPSLPGPYENGNPAYNLPCSYCGMIYKHKRNLMEHREICSRLPVNARTSYACVYCGMTFLIFRKFTSHMVKLHKTTHITCAKCRRRFEPADYLTHHEKHRRNEDPQSSKDNGRSSTSFESPLKDWNDFEAEVHANESRISRQKYSCALCGQEFPTRSELGEHRNLHLKVKIYSCVICRSMFSSAGALEVHMKDHGIEDPVEQSAHTSCVEYEGTEDTKDISLVDGSPAGSESEADRTCKICNKTFTNIANQKRHHTNVHKNSKNRRKCTECKKVFTKKNSFEYHLRTEHKRPPTSSIKCPVCPQTFATRSNLNLHYGTAHANGSTTPYECDICGKQFKEEFSCKIHRGWHARRSRRLDEEKLVMSRNKALLSPRSPDNLNTSTELTERPARARKSFPNSPPAKPGVQLQCQVCDSKFTEVTELRKHLWDVHCARNKSEKNYTTNDLQCELCTHSLPDKQSLERHLEWHMENPILSDSKNGLKRKRYYTPRELRTHPCDICGNFYTSRRSLLRHQKLHKVSSAATGKFQSVSKKSLTNQFQCNICNKVFDSSTKLRQHKGQHFVNQPERNRHSSLEKSDFQCELCLKYYISEMGLRFHMEKTCEFRPQESINPRPKRRRMASADENGGTSVASNAEIDPEKPVPTSSKPSFGFPVGWRTKKMVTCSICQKSFLGKSLFYKHRQAVHQKEIMERAIILTKKKPNSLSATAAAVSSVNNSEFRCTICGKDFPGANNLKFHISSVHKSDNAHRCTICQAAFSTNVGMRNHMQKHATNQFSCNICKRVFRSRPAVFIHLNRQHPDEYDVMQDDKSKLFTEEMGKSLLQSPQINVQTSFPCEYCNMKFESMKGLRVHSIKRHSVRC